MNHAKTLALVTTARSDYSTMAPVMKAASSDQDFQAKIFCGGMHLLDRFGQTWRNLERDGLKIDEKIAFFSDADDEDALLAAMARGVEVFGQALRRQKIDMVVVSGDRFENMPLFTAATVLGIPICHLCGGDNTEGAIDNQVRHMMTKLAHLHMVSMEEHRRRVLQMGEEPWRVTISGDAALDTLKHFRAWTRKELQENEGIPLEHELILCTFHPLTLGNEDYLLQFKNILSWLSEQKATVVITYPNVDPGYQRLLEMLTSFSQEQAQVILKKSFSPQGYYSMMSHARLMLGNSSSGIWEAPSFKLPAINVGMRQQGRTRANNVVDIAGLSLQEFHQANTLIESPQFRKDLQQCVNPYGEGNASQIILEKIKATPLDEKLLVKKFHEVGRE